MLHDEEDKLCYANALSHVPEKTTSGHTMHQIQVMELLALSRTCIFNQVRRKKEKKSEKNVRTAGCLMQQWITYMVWVMAKGTRSVSAVPRFLACNGSESPNIQMKMKMSTDSFDQTYI